jgi:2-polyprenyl-3-methyl-5-hydroxy-6-metoxy-1,4-benzoquinol methylase
MLERILEQEVMDTEEDASQYNSIPNDEVNRTYVEEVLALVPKSAKSLIDLGSGPAHIPILFAQKRPHLDITAIELANSMIAIANININSANLAEKIKVERQDVKKTTFKQHTYDVVISNSIVHHIHQPVKLFIEARRLSAVESIIYFKDLLRPKSLSELEMIVEKYSGDVNDYQRELFYNSLHAALTLDEVKDCAVTAGYENFKITQTSDRHWVLVNHKMGVT